MFVKLGALKVQYCSSKCQELAWGQHHWEECVQVTLLAPKASEASWGLSIFVKGFEVVTGPCVRVVIAVNSAIRISSSDVCV